MASDVFKTKEAFKQCAHVIFRRDHFDLAGKNNLAVAGLEKAEIDSVLSAIPVTKFHRSSLNKSVEEAIVLTDRGNLHLFEIPPSAKQNTSITTPWKLKQTIPIDTITGISLSQLSDGCFALSLPTDKKGDLILKSDLYAIEFASALCLAIKKKSAATGTDRKIDEFVTISNKITLKSTKNQRLQTLQFAKSGGVTNLTIKPTGGGSAAWMFSVPMIT